MITPPERILGLSAATLAAQGNPTVAGLIWLLVALIPLSLGVLCVLEGILAITRQPLITLYIRAFRTVHLLIVEFAALGLFVAVTAAFVHFVVDGSK